MEENKSDLTIKKNTHIFLSIIIPIYNVGDIIRETASSIIKQNCRNFEVILIDDGSNDNSPEIMKELLEANDIPVKHVKQENAGVSAARNKGISLASGEILYFLDADDLTDTDTCQFIIATFSNNENCDMLIFRYDYRDSNNKLLYCAGDNNNDAIIEDTHKLIFDIMKEKYCVHLASTAYRRNILLKNNIKFNVDSGYGEDLEFIAKYLVHCKTIYYSNIVRFHYIKRDGSISNKISLKRLDSLFSFLEIAKYYHKNNLPSEIIDYVKYRKTIKYHITHTKGLFDQVNRKRISIFKIKNYVNQMRTYKNANYLIKKIFYNSLKSTHPVSLKDKFQCNLFLYFPLLSYYIYINTNQAFNFASAIKQKVKNIKTNFKELK